MMCCLFSCPKKDFSKNRRKKEGSPASSAMSAKLPFAFKIDFSSTILFRTMLLPIFEDTMQIIIIISRTILILCPFQVKLLIYIYFFFFKLHIKPVKKNNFFNNSKRITAGSMAIKIFHCHINKLM